MRTLSNLRKEYRSVEWKMIPTGKKFDLTNHKDNWAVSNFGDVWDLSKDRPVKITGKYGDSHFILSGNVVKLSDLMEVLYGETERWKRLIPPINEYEISSWGNVRRVDDGEYMKPFKDKEGVIRVKLTVSPRPLFEGSERMVNGYELKHLKMVDLLAIMFLTPDRKIYKPVPLEPSLKMHIANIVMTELIVRKDLTKKVAKQSKPKKKEGKNDKN